MTRIKLIAAVIAWCIIAPTTKAYAVGDCLDQTGICDRCPVCDHKCELKAELVDAKNECFNVKSKVICIPRVVFPWQKPKCSTGCGACDGVGCTDCVHNGARLRRVCVLEPDSYKCPECKYTWSAKPRPACCEIAAEGLISTIRQEADASAMVDAFDKPSKPIIVPAAPNEAEPSVDRKSVKLGRSLKMPWSGSSMLIEVPVRSATQRK